MDDNSWQNRQTRKARQSIGKSIGVVKTGISPIEQLGLKYDPENKQDMRQLRRLLINAKYASAEIAEVHRRANRLGNMDYKQTIIQGRPSQNNTFFNSGSDPQMCPCCGFIEQSQTLLFKTPLKDINHMGVSTYLFFETIKHLIVLLVSMLLVYSIYSLFASYKASQTMQSIKPNLPKDKDRDSGSANVGFMAFSLASRAIVSSLHNSNDDRVNEADNYAETTFNVQSFLGLAMLAIWIVLFSWIKYRERQAQLYVDYESWTAADFTLKFENMPQNMKTEQLEEQLQKYAEKYLKRHEYPRPWDKKIKINKINRAKPFYLDESTFRNENIEQLNKEYQQIKEKMISWVEYRKEHQQFPVDKFEIEAIYDRIKQIEREKVRIYKQISDKLYNKMRQQEADRTGMPTFVTFDSSEDKELIQHIYEFRPFKSFHKICRCLGSPYHFYYEMVDDSGNKVKMPSHIDEAPEPEDIIWTNLGQSNCEKVTKFLITSAATIVLLVISFFVIFGLSNLQSAVDKQKEVNSSTQNIIMSIAMSVAITIINTIIKTILGKLTIYERNYTHTMQQSSLAIKAIFATLLNTIMIPIMVSKFFKDNLYYKNGLAEDVFYLAITNAFMGPALKLFDAYYFFTRIMAWYYGRPAVRLGMKQEDLNAKTEYMQFELGFEYIYIVNLFLFTCFFVSLQPMLPLIAILGLSLMHFAEKYSLYNRCKRPRPGGSVLNSTMYQLIYAGPLFYTIGNLVWSNFENDFSSGREANTASLILSIVMLVLPYHIIMKKIVKFEPEQDTKFESKRYLLPSEYDRLNPDTHREAVRDYNLYLKKFKENMKYLPRQQQMQVIEEINFQNGNFSRNNNIIVPRLLHGADIEDQNILKKAIGGGENNSVNPEIIKMALVGEMQGEVVTFNQEPQIKTAVQNWLTSEEIQAGETEPQQPVNIAEAIQFGFGHSASRDDNAEGAANMVFNMFGALQNAGAGEQVTFGN